MKTIEDMIGELIHQSCDLLATVRKISETDYNNDAKNFEYLTDRLEILSEKYACSVRDFAKKTYVANRYEVMDKASEMQGIEICKDGKTVIVDLPFLLPRKKGKDHKFIGEPLWYKLEEISKTEDLKLKEKAVICIIHTYDNVNKKARCYDYDNLECKKILDIITLFTLTDDAPEFCDVYQTVQLSDRDKTRVMIMPVDEFRSEKMSLIF